MKKIFTLLALLFIVVQTASSMPAYPKPGQYPLPDGTTVTVQLYGDEFFSYMLTSDGYQVVGHEDGYLYYYTPGIGTKGVAAMRASAPSRRSAAERSYLRTIRSGVDQAYVEAGRNVGNLRRATMMVNNAEEFAPFTSNSAKSRATKALAARSIVILCQYKDVKFQASSTTAAFSSLLNDKGYSKNGAIGSAKDYFQQNSLGAYDPTFDVSPIVTLSENMAYYGAPTSTSSDIRPREMVREACELADKAGVDFSQYDFDNDGAVDNVFVFYAGHNQAENASANTIWPHRWVLSSLSITLDGKVINDYACSSELKGSSGTNFCGIGTFVHEFGHVLGLPDFYDADYEQSGGATQGLYDVCVMSGGGYNGNGHIPAGYTGLERWLVGWAEMKDLSTAPNDLVISPAHTEEGKDCWKMDMVNNPGEFVYIEARQKTSWDQTFQSEGLLIYQIDRSNNLISGIKAIQRWNNNSLNNFPAHPCARLIESGGRTGSSVRHGDMFYPGQSNVTSFLLSSYGFKDWAGNPLPIGLTGISQSNGTVTLRVVKELDLTAVSGTVKDDKGAVVAAAYVSVIEVKAPSSVGLSQMRVVSKAEAAASRASVVYSAVTDGQGKFSIPNIPYGNYSLMIEKTGYDSHIETLAFDKSRVTVDATLKSFVAKLQAQKTWTNGDSKGYLDVENSVWVGASWDAADLTNVVGRQIGGVAVETGSITAYEARLLINNVVVFTSKGSTIAGGRTLVYLPSALTLTLKATDVVRIQFRVESGKNSIALDGGPAVKGKGDLYSENGASWKNLSDNNINANLMIALLINKDSDTPETPSVVATPSQRQCSMQFSSLDGNISLWNLRYKAASGEWKEVNGIKTMSYVLADLAPQTEYQAELIAVFGDKKSAAKAFTFTTTKLTAPFAAIGGVKGRYALNESYTLDCVNIGGDVATLEWKWNGGSIRSESIVFATAGKGRLDCIITYKNGKKEVLSREIVVE